MNSTTDAITKRRWTSYWFDAVLTLAVVFLVLSKPYLVRWVEYHSGMHHDVGSGFFVTLVMRPLAILMTVATVLHAIVRLALKPGTLKPILLRLAFPAIAVLALFVPIKTPGPLAAVFLEGFEHRILREVDIDAIQQWLTTEGVKYAGQSYQGYTSGFPPELPASLVRCQPLYVRFSPRDDDCEETVELGWYTHAGEYGVVIGPRTMKTPEVGMIRRDHGQNEFRRPVKPGAYVFCRG